MDLRLTGGQLYLKAVGNRHRIGGFFRLESVGHLTTRLRLGFAPLLLRDLFAMMGENMSPLHPANNNVRKVVSVDVGVDYLTADTRFTVGLIRNPIDAIFAPRQLEPIDDRSGVPHRALSLVRPIRLAGDNVFQS